MAITSSISAVAAAVAVFTSLPSGLAFMFGIGSLVPMIGLMFVNKENIMLRQNLLFVGAAMMGIGIAPILSIVSLPTLMLALGGTAAIFAGFSLAALRSKSTSFLKFGGVLYGSIFVLIASQLLLMFGPALGISASVLAPLHSLYLYGGLGLFSILIAYDTQNMIARAAAGETDHISDALSIFLDIFGVFRHLLMST